MRMAGATVACIALIMVPALACGQTATDGQAPAEGTNDSPYLVPRALGELRIDGVLDEEDWERALTLELRYEVSPGDNTPAPVRTEVLVLFGRAAVYFGFRCFDPDMGAVRAHLSDRDRAGDDDHVAVVLDTFNDERRSFVFVSNPLGIQTDMVRLEGSNADWSWDAIWDSAGRITDWGYAVEMAIPYSSLRFQREGGDQTWGFDALRLYPRSKRIEIGLAPKDRTIDSQLSQILKIRGFDGASPGRNIEITPTLTAVRTDERPDFPMGDFVTANKKAEAGVTAKWGITPNMTFFGTANPDFSQVEADALQLDINQPFALYYREKRPFFTEGIDFFDTPINAVHTRTMRDPQWGLKLTGKEGANALGAYAVRDDITNLIFPGSQSSSSATLNAANTSSVFRYRRDAWNNSTLGALATDREGGGYFNRVIGFDGLLRFTSRDRFSFQVLGSSTAYPGSVARQNGQPEDEFGGLAYKLYYTNRTRDYFVFVDYLNIGADFRADMGYMPRVDYVSGQLGTGYTWWSDSKAFIHRFQVRGYANRAQDQAGNVLNSGYSGAIILEGPAQTIFAFWPGKEKRNYGGAEFDTSGYYFDFGITPTGNFSFSYEGGFGNSIDYAHARQAETVNFGTNTSLTIGRGIRVNISYSLDQLSVENERLYLANLIDTTLWYQFNNRTFIRAVLQYTDIRRNLDLYAFPVDERSNDLFTQLLFSYKINPRTVLFLGYSDNCFGSRDFGLTRYDRSFFIKLGYAWVL